MAVRDRGIAIPFLEPVEVWFRLSVFVLVEEGLSHDEIQLRIVGCAEESLLRNSHGAPGVVVAEIRRSQTQHRPPVGGRDSESLLILGLGVVKSLELLIDVAEQDVAAHGVRFELLEAGQGLEGQPLVGLNGPVERFKRMRLARAPGRGSGRRALVIAGEERAGSEEAELFGG